MGRQWVQSRVQNLVQTSSKVAATKEMPIRYISSTMLTWCSLADLLRLKQTTYKMLE